MEMHIEKIGRRNYLRNTPYAAKDAIKAAGCRWDPEERSWWTAKADRAAVVLAEIKDSGSGGGGSGYRNDARNDARGTSTLVIGRASYKDQEYFLVWQGRTRRGEACKLAFRDGSRTFWADADKVTVGQLFDRKLSIHSLDPAPALAPRYSAPRYAQECSCYCHSESNAGQPGSILFDGCDRCGCEAT